MSNSMKNRVAELLRDSKSLRLHKETGFGFFVYHFNDQDYVIEVNYEDYMNSTDYPSEQYLTIEDFMESIDWDEFEEDYILTVG